MRRFPLAVLAIWLGGVALLGCADHPTGLTVGGVYLFVKSPTSITVPQLDRFQIEAQAKSYRGELLDDSVIHYESDHPGIVRVSATGEGESVGPPGTATVTVSAGSQEKSIVVTVTTVPAEVRLSTDSVAVQIGNPAWVDATAYDVTGSVIPNLATQYVVADTTVARVLPYDKRIVLFGQRVGRTSLTVSVEGTALDTVVPVETLRDTAIVARIPLPGGPQSVAITPYGAFVTLTAGALVRLDLTTLEIAGTLPLPGGTLDVVATPDSGTLFVTQAPFYSGPRGIQVIDAVTMTQDAFIPLDALPELMAMHPDGGTVFVAAEFASDGPAVYVVDVASRAIRDSIDVTNDSYGIVGLDVDPDGSRLYVSTMEGIMVFDTQSLAFVKRYAILSLNVRVARTTNELYVARVPLSVIDLTTGTTSTVDLHPDVGSSAFALGFDSDEAYLYVGRTCGRFTWPYVTNGCVNGADFQPYLTVSIVDVATHEEVKIIRTMGMAGDFGFTPDGLVIIPNRSGWIDVIRAQ